MQQIKPHSALCISVNLLHYSCKVWVFFKLTKIKTHKNQQTETPHRSAASLLSGSCDSCDAETQDLQCKAHTGRRLLGKQKLSQRHDNKRCSRPIPRSHPLLPPSPLYRLCAQTLKNICQLCVRDAELRVTAWREDEAVDSSSPSSSAVAPW